MRLKSKITCKHVSISYYSHYFLVICRMLLSCTCANMQVIHEKSTKFKQTISNCYSNDYDKKKAKIGRKKVVSTAQGNNYL